MPRKPSSRKFQLTINNPTEHGYTHERIRSTLSEFPGLLYWCMCDEVGEQGTPHTHVYMVSRNSIMFDSLHVKFYGAHVEQANGSNKENRDYVRKEGKWLDDAKHETNLADTFEEWGELPPDRTRRESQAEQIMQMVRDGKSNAEILAEIPTAFSKLHYIDQARQTLLQEQYKEKWRQLDVTHTSGAIPEQERPVVSWTPMDFRMSTKSPIMNTPLIVTKVRISSSLRSSAAV